MTIGERIQSLRGKESRRAFAERIGIVENTLRNYEKGLSLPNSDIIAQICSKTGSSLEWLIYGTGGQGEKTSAPRFSAEDTATLLASISRLEHDNEILREQVRDLRRAHEGLLLAIKGMVKEAP